MSRIYPHAQLAAESRYKSDQRVQTRKYRLSYGRCAQIEVRSKAVNTEIQTQLRQSASLSSSRHRRKAKSLPFLKPPHPTPHRTYTGGRQRRRDGRKVGRALDYIGPCEPPHPPRVGTTNGQTHRRAQSSQCCSMSAFRQHVGYHPVSGTVGYRYAGQGLIGPASGRMGQVSSMTRKGN